MEIAHHEVLADEAIAENKAIALSNPYNTVYALLYYLQRDSYQPEQAGRTLNAPEDWDTKQRQKHAVFLKRIIDGRGIYIDLDAIPQDPNYTDSVGGKAKHIYYLHPDLPRVTLEKVGDRWLFSERTVQFIPEMLEEVFPFGTAQLIEILPAGFQKEFLYLELWQWLGIVVLAGVAWLVYLVLSWLFENIVNRILSRIFNRIGQAGIARKFIAPATKPASMFFVLLFVWYFIGILQLPPQLGNILRLAFKVLVPVFAIAVFYRLCDLLGEYLRRMADKSESTLDDQLVPLLNRVLHFIVIIIGVLYILDSFSYNITALLAGLSIGGLAFALAAQDTVKNFFGSLMIFLDKPFQVGDWIVAAGVEGTVEEVGMRATRLRTFYNSLVYVPNAQLVDSSVDNMGLRVYRRYVTTLGLTYDTPPELIDAFVNGLREMVERHPDTRKDAYEIHFNGFGASSLNIMVYIFFKVGSWTEELEARHEFNMAALRLAEELGVGFAFPTQTLHVQNFPDKSSLDPSYETDASVVQGKLRTFVDSLNASGKKGAPFGKAGYYLKPKTEVGSIDTSGDGIGDDAR